MVASIDTSSVWRVNTVMDDGSGTNYFLHDNYRYYLSGDTSISAFTYHKIYKAGVSFGHDFFNGSYHNFYYYGDIYAGALRIDNNVWYFVPAYPPFPPQDTLLYDFNLGVGDTLISWLNDPCDTITISSIDSILIGNVYKKRFHLSNTVWVTTPYIIQDIGSFSGLLEPLCIFDWFPELVCFAQNGQSLWGMGTEECDLLVNVSKVEDVDNHVKTYPNPFTTSTTFSYTLNKPSTVTLGIFNPQGQLIEKIEQEQSKGEQQMQWNAEGLPAGMYYYRIAAGKLTGSGKLIIK
ncbi:MAG: T9SS type A sorting domain-containing protein [Bacteroidota bacterium]|nr:T9SS type A sorting domain-containing protein [Bacteroidota bacterium]